MTTTTGRMTMGEFQALPEGPPYFEFEQGELIEMPSPTSRHQKIVLVLSHALLSFVTRLGLGDVFMEVDVYLPDDRGYIPDVTFLSRERLHLHRAEDDKVHGVPDLVVEVLSSDPARDRVDKFAAYAANGVPWYWIVDPSDYTVEEYHLTPEGYLRTGGVRAGQVFRPRLFPGLELDLRALVEPPTSPGPAAPPPAQA